MADVKSAKTKKSTKEATHPKYIEMVTTAIETLKERKGSSRAAILKFITSKYKVSDNPNVVNSKVKLALKKGVENVVLTQVKGSGASGSFKLSKKVAEKPKKVVKSPKKAKSPMKAKAKKVAAKSSKAVKSPKKVSKSPKKAAKSPKKSTKSPKTATKPKPKKATAEKINKKAAKPRANKPAKKPTKK